jgi:hypothetical protein
MQEDALTATLAIGFKDKDRLALDVKLKRA